MTPPKRQGTVLFAHGSRDPSWHEPIEAVARSMRVLEPEARVLCAYLELTAPDLSAAAAELAAAGCETITVWPMFLGQGRHLREDLPRLVADLQKQHPALHVVLERPISEHPAVLNAMANAALGRSV